MVKIRLFGVLLVGIATVGCGGTAGTPTPAGPTGAATGTPAATSPAATSPAATTAAPATPASPSAQTVRIAGFAFQPAQVTVRVGTTVTWQNGDQAPHTATADDRSFDTGRIEGGQTGRETFQTAGTFPYHCDIHPNMKGTVTVTL